jgi:hypothetical protein
MIGMLRDREPGMLELARFLGPREVQRHVKLTEHGHELARQFGDRVAQRIADLLAPLTARERAQLSGAASLAVGLYAAERSIDLRTAATS